MKKILVTGSNGFIGKNLILHLKTQKQYEILSYEYTDSLDCLEEKIAQADFIFHLAGVNRPIEVEEFQKGNVELTNSIVRILKMRKKTIPIMFSSSIQCELNTPYGDSKKQSEDLLKRWAEKEKSRVYIYRLPNVFGKWAKPNYNSVIATFCYNISHGLPIEIHDEYKTITLVYIDDLVRNLCLLLKYPEPKDDYYINIEPKYDYTIKEISNILYSFEEMHSLFIVPNFENNFIKKLYATYVSYLEAERMGYSLKKNCDNRGWLAEFIKGSSFGQIFLSKTKPGITRGEHWHSTKMEKFLVVSGIARITLRNVLDESRIEFYVKGDDMKVIDIPVGYTHKIRNIGKEDLVTVFYTNELFDEEHPDTYKEEV